tara:strand:- start:253 stop:912 length:660 start_codon:yes stop_codon:yes gene_type:complete
LDFAFATEKLNQNKKPLLGAWRKVNRLPATALLIARALPIIMKKLIQYSNLIFIIMILGCTNNHSKPKIESKYSEQKILGILDETSEIELLREDDKYGEWGGDIDLIRIYRYNKNTYADYLRYVGRNIPLPSPNEMEKKWYEYKTLETKIDSIKLNINEKQLIEISIINLLKNKLRNENIPVYGIYNSAISKDSSIVVKDYNSFDWKSFVELKTSLKKK